MSAACHINFLNVESISILSQEGDEVGVIYYAVILWFEGHKNKI
jgi:hypothetical protein